MNTFMNVVKRSLMEGGTRGRVRAFGGVEASVEASSLPALNPRIGPWPASSSYSSMGSAGGLMRGLRRAQDPGAIAIKI